MGSELDRVLAQDGALDLRTEHGVLGVMELWIASLKPTTRRTYAQAINMLAKHLDTPPAELVRRFLSDATAAHAIAAEYRGWMLSPVHGEPPRPLAPNTVATRIAALRSLVAFAGQGDDGLRLINWSLTTKKPRHGALRDTSGPPADRMKDILAYSSGAVPERDQAILALLYYLVLRCGEVASLDLADIDFGRGHIMILAKGKREKEPVPIPPKVRVALESWIKIRGDWSGPLFHNVSNGHGNSRLSARSIYDISKNAGLRAGVRGVHPHGFRHTGITTALKKCNGDVRRVQQFSRHASIATVQVYDDNRRKRDSAAEIAVMLEEDDE